MSSTLETKIAANTHTRRTTKSFSTLKRLSGETRSILLRATRGACTTHAMHTTHPYSGRTLIGHSFRQLQLEMLSQRHRRPVTGARVEPRRARCNDSSKIDCDWPIRSILSTYKSFSDVMRSLFETKLANKSSHLLKLTLVNKKSIYVI